MPLKSNRIRGQTANREAFRRTFLRHVHRLLQLGYESLIPANFTTSEEDEITGEICKRMKQLTEEEPVERWMAHYSIHDQDPLNDSKCATTGQVRFGKRRPRLDIRLVGKSRVPNTQFCVEAKRLYRSDSVNEYLNSEGVGAFVHEYYAAQDDAAAMIGYVQTDSVAGWLKKIQKGLEKTDASGGWTLSQFPDGPLHTYRSVHRRKTGNRQIEIFHTFLNFC